MRTSLSVTALGAALLLASSASSFAQSSGASPADPNNERNLTPAPSTAQPTDPAANNNPAARIPTAPVDRMEAQQEEGGATGTRPGPAVVPPAQ